MAPGFKKCQVRCKIKLQFFTSGHLQVFLVLITADVECTNVSGLRYIRYL